MEQEKRQKLTIVDLYNFKKEGEKVSWLSIYDYSTALYADKAGIEIILVGDSGAMTMLGHKNTLPVTIDQMIWMAQAVTRAVQYSFVIGDMPYMSYQISKEEAIRNAGRFMAEGNVDAVKLEGGVNIADTVEAVVKSGIPVLGHIGVTPQSLALLGGYKSRGRDADTALGLIRDAKALETAGAFGIILEAVPAQLTEIIMKETKIPIYSIGGGPCDGQLLIVHDMLGLFELFKPKFVKRYAELGKELVKAFSAYRQEVKSGAFPGPEHVYNIPQAEYQKLLAEIEQK